MADKNNVTLMLPEFGGVDRPLAYEELDANFLELQRQIEEYNTFYRDEYTSSQKTADQLRIEYDQHVEDQTNKNAELDATDGGLQGQIDDVYAEYVEYVESNDQRVADLEAKQIADDQQRIDDLNTHVQAEDPHPQYTTDPEATQIAVDNAITFAIALG